MVKVSRERIGSINEKSSTQELIRSAIIAELDATSLYQSQIENTDDEGAKRVLSHIRDEEKEHIAELSCLLMSIDPTQREDIEEIIQKQFPYDINLVMRNCIINKSKKEEPTEKNHMLLEEKQYEIPVKERAKRAREFLSEVG